MRFEPADPNQTVQPPEADSEPLLLPPECAELAARLTAQANQLADLYPAYDRESQHRDFAWRTPGRRWSQAAWRGALAALAPLLLIVLLSTLISRVKPHLPLAQLPPREARVEPGRRVLPAEGVPYGVAIPGQDEVDLGIVNAIAVNSVTGPELEGLLDLWGEADSVQRVDLDAIFSR